MIFSKYWICTILLLCIFTEAHSQNLKISVEGSSLQFHLHEQADSVLFSVTGGPSVSLSSQNNEQWTGSLSVSDPDSLMITFTLYTFRNGYENKVEGEWIGDKASLFQPKENVKGSISTHTMYSNSLSEERSLTIYSSPQEIKKWVVFVADGDIVTKYAPFVENLIQKNNLPGILLVGIHNGNKKDNRPFDLASDRRSMEYLEGLSAFLPNSDSTLFDRHLNFFTLEVDSLLSKKYGSNYPVENRIIFGFSNGAAFALSTSFLKPEFFQHAILGSFGWELALNQKNRFNNKKHQTAYYLGAGTLEPGFLSNSIKLRSLLKNAGYSSELTTYHSAHEEIMWRQLFLTSLVNIGSELK